jgi:hypothetical protein
MDPLFSISARQQQQRLSEVSRRFHRDGVPRRSARGLRVSIDFGALVRVLDVVKSWRSPVRWVRSVRRGSES